jgi:Family of unknown function (DUF6510)
MTDPVTLDPIAARRLDGNAAGGILAEVFAVDVTAARSRCAGCGTTSMLGAHHVYADAPAMVLRCPTCTGMVLRVGLREGRILLDLSGSRLLEIPVPGSPGGGRATEDGGGELG